MEYNGFGQTKEEFKKPFSYTPGRAPRTSITQKGYFRRTLTPDEYKYYYEFLKGDLPIPVKVGVAIALKNDLKRVYHYDPVLSSDYWIDKYIKIYSTLSTAEKTWAGNESYYFFFYQYASQMAISERELIPEPWLKAMYSKTPEERRKEEVEKSLQRQKIAFEIMREEKEEISAGERAKKQAAMRWDEYLKINIPTYLAGIYPRTGNGTRAFAPFLLRSCPYPYP